MKGLPRRLLLYGSGLALGLVLALSFVRGKLGGELPEFCYLPNCRVLKELRSKPFGLRSEIPFECTLDSTTVREMLKEGRVNFGQSRPRTEPCGEYQIEGEDWVMQARNCPDSVYIRITQCPGGGQ